MVGARTSCLSSARGFPSAARGSVSATVVASSWGSEEWSDCLTPSPGPATGGVHEHTRSVAGESSPGATPRDHSGPKPNSGGCANSSHRPPRGTVVAARTWHGHFSAVKSTVNSKKYTSFRTIAASMAPTVANTGSLVSVSVWHDVCISGTVLVNWSDAPSDEYPDNVWTEWAHFNVKKIGRFGSYKCKKVSYLFVPGERSVPGPPSFHRVVKIPILLPLTKVVLVKFVVLSRFSRPLSPPFRGRMAMPQALCRVVVSSRMVAKLVLPLQSSVTPRPVLGTRQFRLSRTL